MRKTPPSGLIFLCSALSLTMSGCNLLGSDSGTAVSLAESNEGSPSGGAPPAQQLSYSGQTFSVIMPFYPQFATVIGMPTSLVPTNSGDAITGCAISPSLPSGLSLSSTNCSITGTPTQSTMPILYAVTASSGSKSSTAILALGVSPAGTKMVATSQSSYVLTTGHSTSITIEQGGGAPTNDCYTGGSLPAGLSMSGCTLSGTPTTAANVTDIIYNSSDGTPVFGGYQLVPYYYHSVGPGTYNLTGMPADIAYISMNVYSQTTQPVLTYGGALPFAEAKLAVGQAMTAIVPTNSGHSISSCTSSPALPAGLVLSQTDCSVSGTPTTAQALTAYTLTPKNGATSGNPLTVKLSIAPSSVAAMSCQSGTICVHNLMPLWDQSDGQLRAYVNATEGLSLTHDPGWCGAVSGAMVLSSYFQEVQTYTGLQPTAIPSPYTAGMTEYPFIDKTMHLLGTNIAGGGTTGAPNNGMINMLGNCMQTDAFDPVWGFSYNTVAYNSPQSFRQGMPLGWLTVCSQSGGLGACHALAVNGTEGNSFKIYDPWGTVYDASISVTFPAPANNLGYPSTISFVSGNTDDFVDVESAGTAAILSTDWIAGYVYTPTGPVPSAKCSEP